jgi:hypothetical protein
MLLDIIHHPIFIWKHRSVYFSKHNVLETGFCLCFQVKPTQLGPINRASTYLWRWAQLSRFYVKTETESSLRNVVFRNIYRTVDNVQQHNSCKKNCVNPLCMNSSVPKEIKCDKWAAPQIMAQPIPDEISSVCGKCITIWVLFQGQVVYLLRNGSYTYKILESVIIR